MTTKKELFREILSHLKDLDLKNPEKAKYDFNRIKRNIIREKKISDEIPGNVELSNYATQEEISLYSDILSIKPMRTASGVSVVAVMSKPMPCPHGKCIFCGGGVDSVFGSVPQSYTGHEPATRRAIRNNYDPYIQMMNRLEQYSVLGKDPEKVELIVMGGTFPSFPDEYQLEFIYLCFKAMNDFSRLFYKKKNILSKDKTFDIKRFREFFELPGDIDDESRGSIIREKILAEKSRGFNENKKSIKTLWKNLEKEQEKNEKSKIKCVGLTLETRSDVITKEKADFMLKLGCTRIELGIQSVYDDILRNVNRGHGTKENIDAISILRDHGFKLNFHMMPGLPGVSKEDDVKSLLQLFQDDRYRPDMLKIYPCMVIEGTKLFDMYKEGKFKPLSTKEAAEIIIELKKKIPSYCRIMRVQRDIPTERTVAGVGMTNLRQYIDEMMIKENIECNCIRCKEPKGNPISEEIKIKELTYDANEGTEIFIYAHDEKNDYILGFCRLRIPNKFLRQEITQDSALVRELHVYGLLAAAGSESNVQHKGLGTKLLKRAEKLAEDYGRKKMIIISGVGVREYYRKKHNYKREGPYMVKKIK